jgi:hypothetical protein
MGGVTSLTTSTFNPKPIVMSGSFGKSFKLLISPPIKSRENGLDLGGDGGLQLNTNILSATLKSGYGAIKLLERILVKSKELDLYNQPYRLFLYLPLVGHNFLVEYENFSLKQDVTSSNMLWKYNVKLTAIAPLNQSTKGGSGLLKMLAADILQRGSNGILNKIKSNGIL